MTNHAERNRLERLKRIGKDEKPKAEAKPAKKDAPKKKAAKKAKK